MRSWPCRACLGLPADCRRRRLRVRLRTLDPERSIGCPSSLTPHEGGDRTAFHPAGDAADEEWGDNGEAEVVPKESPLLECPDWRSERPPDETSGPPRNPSLYAYHFRATSFYMRIT